MENRHPVRCSDNEEAVLFLRRKRQEMAETNDILGNLGSTLSIAYRSICNAKTPIKTLNDLCQIKGVGKWILRLMLGFFQESVAEEPSANHDAPWDRKKAKEPKRYIPQKNSAAYALLITLYRAMQNGASYMNQQELIDASEKQVAFLGLQLREWLDKSKQPESLGSSRNWYTGWSCMKTLMSRGLVLKSSCPAKFMLTQEGKEAAHECLIRSGNLQSMSESNRCHCISDAQRSFVVKLTSQPATASCQQKVIDISNKVADKLPVWLSYVNLRGKQADLSDLNVDYAIQRKQSISTFISSPIVEDIMTTISATDMKSQIPDLHMHKHKPPANDGIKGNDILARPPYNFGEKFQDMYDVILILDDRENFGSRSRKVIDNIQTQFNIPVEVRCLPVGDGIWLARGRGCNTEYVLDFIVERKRVDDLCKSIWDNRYRDQKLRLQVFLYKIFCYSD
ncbi:hypothetical protein ZIOFF_074797 [Zingiber officinale]|uniref:Crossover junction endonuclease MUS81 n=1 Tax=Zingiber officinale TaxID=94328 RepID=A0A8J5C1I2_ZINOF|nr:hypothetical protein ZIOFF_074797 [Zingiber officinale]